MEAVADAAGVTKPVVYACFAGKDELFRALLRPRGGADPRRDPGSLRRTSDLDAIREATLIEGFTGFLGPSADSPEVYRLIFLGEGGGNTAVARRIQRGRQAQVDALSLLAREGWSTHREARRRTTPRSTARLLGNAIAGLAESGARLLLSGERRLDARDARTRARPLGGRGSGEYLNVLPPSEKG